MILFRPDRLSDRGCVLNVELPQGSTLDDWQFRLLQASMHLCSLLDDGPVPEGAASQSTDTPLQRVVARYTNGRVFKGFCRDFTPSQPHFTVWPAPTASEDERVMLPVKGLKAVFFVRDLGGDSAYVEEKTFEQPSHGRRVEVTFHDDEVLVGTTLGYRADATEFLPEPRGSAIEQLAGVHRHERGPSRPLPRKRRGSGADPRRRLRPRLNH